MGGGGSLKVVRRGLSQSSKQAPAQQQLRMTSRRDADILSP
jgi:hypothetical protein